MLAVKNSHKFGLVNHHLGSKGQVEIKGKETIEQLKTVALEANVGDIILLNKYLIHCSLPNKSNDFRVSMDLRYNKSGQPSGRDPLPCFAVKSKNKKNIKVNNYKQWIALWEKAKNKCIPRKWSYKYPLPTFKNSLKRLKKYNLMQSVTKRVYYFDFVFALLGYFLFVCQDTISKELVTRYHSTQIVLLASITALITVVLYTNQKKAWRKIKKANFTVHFLEL